MVEEMRNFVHSDEGNVIYLPFGRQVSNELSRNGSSVGVAPRSPARTKSDDDEERPMLSSIGSSGEGSASDPSSLAYPLHLLANLPGELQARPGREGFDGTSSYGKFLITPMGEELRLTLWPITGASRRTCTVRADYFPQSSPWSLIERVSDRLAGSAGTEVRLDDLQSELGLLMESSRLVDQKNHSLTALERAALLSIGIGSGLDRSGWSLLLSHPYQIWAATDGHPTLWSGYSLPRPLDRLSPTTHAFRGGNGHMRYAPVEITGTVNDTSALEQMRELSQLNVLGAAALDELEQFSEMLGNRLAQRRCAEI